MISSKALSLLEILSLTSGYTSQEVLSYKLQIKPRTLRELLRLYKEEIEKDGSCHISYKNNYGYHLDILDQTSFHNYILTQKEEINKTQLESPITSQERATYIIRHLLTSKDPIKSDDFCDSLIISKSTLAQDLKLVRSILVQYDLQLDVKNKQGLYIQGSKENYQSLFADYFFYNYNDSSLKASSSYDKQWIHDLLVSTLQSHHYHMTDTGIDNLVIHIFIAIYLSNKLNDSTPSSIPSLDKENYKEEFAIAKELQTQIENKTQIHIEDDDLTFMVVHMIGNRVFTENDAPILSADTINTVRTILSSIRSIYDIDLFNDIELFTMLCTHIEPMIERIQNHVRMRNPLLPSIQEENPVGYDMAVLASNILAKKYHAEVDTNEIGYLALHFQLALERKTLKKKKKILTVCASGAGTSKLLKYKIEQNYGNHIETLDSTSVNEISHKDVSSYDLIISTVPLSIPYKPVIVVNGILTNLDYQNIDNFLNTSNEQSSQILKAFEEDLFFPDIHETNPTKLVTLLCNELKKKINLPDSFLPSILNREHIASTNLGNGIAVPHPSSVLLEDNKIVIAHLHKPILWFDNKEVEWVFLLGIKKGEDSLQENLIRSLYSCISDIAFMQELSSSPRYITFYKKMTSLLKVQEATEPESIFQ